MRPTVVHISGPPGSGKTTLARIIAARRPSDKPHYLRFETNERPSADQGGFRDLRISPQYGEMASSGGCTFAPELVFEEVPERLLEAAQGLGRVTLLIESDAEPCFRCAYPYDVKVFIMRPPANLSEVFRSPQETAETIHRALDDTAEFASEVFGLAPEAHDLEKWPDAGGHDGPAPARGAERNVDEFLDSDVGAEIAVRLQLQPRYHAIVDNDVVLLNEAIGDGDGVAEPCAERITALLETLQRRLGRESWFAACDPLDPEDPLGQRCIERIEALIDAGEAEGP